MIYISYIEKAINKVIGSTRELGIGFVTGWKKYIRRGQAS